MMASPISRTVGSSVCSESCHSRWSVSEVEVDSVFSIGGSSLHFLRRARPVAVVEVVAEEVLVVVVVPGVVLGLGLRRLGFLLGGGLRLGGLEILGRDLLEQRVLDHFLLQQVRELERRHRQQLDGLLQRGRQNELLRELGLEFLLKMTRCAGTLLQFLVQPEIGPEVNPPHLFVVGESSRGAVPENGPVVTI